MSATNIVVMTMLAAFGLAFADAAQVTLRRCRGWKRWVGGLALTVPALGLLAAIGVLGKGAIITFLPREVPLVALSPSTPDGANAETVKAERIARGAHIALTTCASCHSPDNTLPLRGGADLSEVIDVGTIYGPNLTPGGRIAAWTDEEIVRAIRNGTDVSNRRLVAMPTERLRNMSDDDLAAVIAYLRSQPAIDDDLPEYEPWMVLFILVGFNIITDSEPVLTPVVAPERAPTAEYGAYLVSYRDCGECHGTALDGVVKEHYPDGIPLLYVRDWTLEQFVTTMRTGISPDGDTLQPPMHWQSYGAMDDLELTAVFEFMKSVPLPAPTK